MQTSGTVFVVDDNELIRRLATALLTKNNYDVSTAVNGMDALELISTVQPDVILLDVMMPKMDGFECCSRLKKNKETHDIPVILVSSNTETIDKIKGLEIGASDYIVKPFDYGELLARVSTQVKMKSLLDELGKKNSLLEELVKKDSLTNLYNHRYFYERLAEEFTASKRTNNPLSCIICDIDRFKSINDTHGHQAGDEILKSLAAILSNEMRTDDVASRYGGEEFALIFPDTGIRKAKARAERIRRNVENNVLTFGGIQISATISIGVASIPDNNAESHIELICFADEALYAAKQAGRNKTVISRH
jgi:diguanylate cyclase (GGDEF)-like protein